MTRAVETSTDDVIEHGPHAPDVLAAVGEGLSGRRSLHPVGGATQVAGPITNPPGRRREPQPPVRLACLSACATQRRVGFAREPEPQGLELVGLTPEPAGGRGKGEALTEISQEAVVAAPGLEPAAIKHAGDQIEPVGVRRGRAAGERPRDD